MSNYRTLEQKRETEANYRRARPEKNRVRNRRGYIKYRFGISAEVYDAKKAAQPLCGVCNEPMIEGSPNGRDPVLDHDPMTEQVRDFVHRHCNAAMGMFDDDPVKLRLAAEYLEKHRGATNVRHESATVSMDQ